MPGLVSLCRFEAKYPGDFRRGAGIRRVGDTVHDPDLREIEGAYALDAGDIDAELARIERR